MKTALAVSLSGMPRNSASAAMVSTLGVATSSSGSGFGSGRRRLAEGGDLAVGAVAAGVAEHQRVLADGGERHELVRHAAAHHARVALDGDRVEVAAVGRC